MEYNKHKQSTAEEALEHYKEDVTVPKDGLIRLLDALPEESATPALIPLKRYAFPWKVMIPAFAVVLIAAGVITYHISSNGMGSGSATPLFSANNDSNAALDQEINIVDQQIAGLNADGANVDQAFNLQHD